ncbi:transglutaminase family protein [Roseiconus nitratireducens]|uniref:Transglutaminase family protein n=1 Tax=Roseiconus nitratireducens TaxID=2605748 RepID=A0A5M6DE31_9BACT|nr:transglutaminase family protein [Roseiconus nitratireducens]KAA5544399.1 transglutaminase family protein [Roseiconus nitratireducens]
MNEGHANGGQANGGPKGDPLPENTAATPGAAPAALPTAVRYRIRHSTSYQYSQNVAVCQNQLRMQPISGGNVICHRSTLTVVPEPSSRDEHFDYFGNRVQAFSIESKHRSLSVVVESQVTIRQPRVVAESASPPWETCLKPVGQRGGLPLRDEHRYASPRVAPGRPFADYARESFGDGRGIVEAALDLTRRIHHDFAYDTTATDVNTTTERAFELRAGVCQDFAHVQIACLRSIGLAARYVSGYLRTVPPPGKPRLVGADESHAWLEVFAGEDLGWLGLDPTNACLVGMDHIPVSLGRDYGDVSPMRGVVLGGGTHTLKVSVDVAPAQEVAGSKDASPPPNSPPASQPQPAGESSESGNPATANPAPSPDPPTSQSQSQSQPPPSG